MRWRNGESISRQKDEHIPRTDLPDLIQGIQIDKDALVECIDAFLTIIDSSGSDFTR